jgi:membrane fusion protein (multidrug efflux system)
MTQTNSTESPTEPSFSFQPSGLRHRLGRLRLGRLQLSRFRLSRSALQRMAIGAVFLLLAAGLAYYLHIISFESTDDAFIDGRIVPISPRVSGHVAHVYIDDNQKVKAGDLLLEIDPRDYQARLDAAKAALHAAEASGRSREIDINLTTINTSADLEGSKASVAAAQAMVQNAQALADAARSQKNEAQAQVAYTKAALGQVQAELLAAQAKYQQSAADLKRYRELAESNTISHQQLERAATAERMAAADRDATRSKVVTQRSMVQRAQAALKAAEDNVRQAEAQVSARQGQLEQAKARLTSAHSAPQLVAQSNSRAEASKADIEKARAEVEQATLNLSYTKIVAPFGGYVTKKNVEPGAFVQVGQSLMAVVSPEIWVSANYKETQLTRMRPGQPATIMVDTYPDMTFHGHVQSIQRGTGSRFSLLPPENATGNYVKVVQRVPVKIVFDRPEELARYLLVPGMSVVPEINIEAQGPFSYAGDNTKAADAAEAKRPENHTAP